MLEKTFAEKFSKEKYTLERALDREIILPIDKPKLWKKILKYFDDCSRDNPDFNKLEFLGEIEADYIMVLNRISIELNIPVMI